MSARYSSSTSSAIQRSFSSRSLEPSGRRRRTQTSSRGGGFPAGPLLAFLLIASFGILFAGCSPLTDVQKPGDKKGDEFTITQQDIARFRSLSDKSASGSALTQSGAVPRLDIAEGTRTGSGSATSPTHLALDLSMVAKFNALRQGMKDSGKNTYQVTNEFVNIRDKAQSNAANIAKLNRGDTVTLVSFVDASWAKVEFAAGKQGYVSARYIARLVSADKLAEEKKAFEGLYYVNYAFVNVRSAADSKSEKLGEVPGQAFLKPEKVDQGWATISFQGKKGYVSMQYLAPFMPAFVVQVNEFKVPILVYDLSENSMVDTLLAHAAELKKQGVKFLTMRDLFATVSAGPNAQPVPANSVIIAVTNFTIDNTKKVSDALTENGVRATFFLQTDRVGLSGITERILLTLVANGFDIESAGHTGDDLRSLTTAQLVLELEQSRKILEDQTHTSVMAFLYPQGGVNSRVSDKLAEAGYLFGIGDLPYKTFTRDQFIKLPSYSVSTSMTGEDVLKLIGK